MQKKYLFFICLFFFCIFSFSKADEVKQSVATKDQMSHQDRRKYCLKAFRYLPDELKNRSSNFNYLKAKKIFSKYKSAIIEYDKHCLRAEKSLLPWARNAIKGSYGYFISTSDISLRPFCMGFFIADKKIMTARHCMASKSYYRNTDKFVFVLASDSETKFSIVKSKSFDVFEFTDQNDQIILELKEITPKGFSKVKILHLLSEVQDGSAFLIPTIGVHLLTGIGDFDGRSPIEFSYGLNCIKTPEKYVKEKIPDGCLIHACQTLPGASGSPIFHADNEKNVFIAGMHLRGGLTSVRVGRGCGSHEKFNVGIIVGGMNK